MAVNDRMRSRSQHSKQKILSVAGFFAIAGFFDGLIPPARTAPGESFIPDRYWSGRRKSSRNIRPG